MTSTAHFLSSYLYFEAKLSINQEASHWEFTSTEQAFNNAEQNPSLKVEIAMEISLDWRYDQTYIKAISQRATQSGRRKDL